MRTRSVHRAGRWSSCVNPFFEFLGSQRQQQARAKFVDNLRTKASDVRVLLEPPRVEVTLAATDASRGPDTAPVTIIGPPDYQ